MAMSTMKDQERLELLKEIGGTKVYEERRKESLRILHDTDKRRQRILEVVSASCRVCLPCWGPLNSKPYEASDTYTSSVFFHHNRSRNSVVRPAFIIGVPSLP